ncbi:acetyl-CoA acetyltransferase [Corynebacterium sp.]|uniref:acetyl-CoA acetyltransferase n=1 Tax=Corynebacterium sp. TaxID=1720 RepID=UPI002647A89C|nr:acetyl-CoA acetyltransferase [Corynebacterium sp.]MDN5720154.1 acetyl-CoA acetyltransferase [Corynebacterium sp.]
MTDTLDPRTPVLVGVGQVADPVTAEDYHRYSAADLAGEAARRAAQDAGVEPSCIDTVAAVRQFEISTPGASAPLGRSDNIARSIAARIGADPRRAVLEVVGGQGPQHLVTEFSKAIADGDAEVVLLAGSEAISTVRALTGPDAPGTPDEAPDFTETVGGKLEDRGMQVDDLHVPYEVRHGLLGAPPEYAVFENARRRRLGLSRAEYTREMGELFAPFTRVAASNPYAAAPTERSAEELTTVTRRNRVIADPYPRFMVARDQVNQGAAVLLTSVGRARELGIAQDRWVFLHGYSDLTERTVLQRADLSTSPAAALSATTALERAGVGPGDLDFLDLYSCFPVPVFTICEALGIAPDDPRGLTLTGGLPFFGGAGNNYSMHAIAETVDRLRENPGTVGFVGANGGWMTKYSSGVYSTTPVAFTDWDDRPLQDALDAEPAPEVVEHYTGPATVESCTVTTDLFGERIGVVVGRTPDGARLLAVTDPGAGPASERASEEIIELLTTDRVFDATVQVEQDGDRNIIRAGTRAELR